MSMTDPPGGTPADALPDGTPIAAEPIAPEEPPAYEPPKGDEPWYPVLADVPEILHPQVVSAFRAQEAAVNDRINKLTPYEQLANAGIDPSEAALAAEFAAMLYGEPDPNNAVATQQQKEAQLRFYQQYGEILRQRGFLAAPEQAAAAAEAERQQQLEREMETPEQRTLRELREQQQALLEQQQAIVAQQQSQQTAQLQSQLTEAFKQDWQQAITKNGQVSKREFGIISMLAQQDQDQSPGVIQRAYDTMIQQYGRLPDPDPQQQNPQPRPPIATAAGAAASIPVPAAVDMRIGAPEGRHNRRQAALEAMRQLEQEGAPSV